MLSSSSLEGVTSRWCLADIANSSTEDDYCRIFMGGNSELIRMEANKYPPSKKSRREKTRERRVVAAAAAASSETMEEQIWKELPEDMVEAIIARLPIAAFFRFRSVCQRWNSILGSKSFSRHCEEAARPHPWFYTITHENMNTGAMYDPSLKKWHHPALPFLPPKMIILPLASAGGLVCSLDIGHRNFYVSNPLTDSFRELPPRSVRVWSRVAVGMILNGGGGGGYKIMWLGSNGDHEIYDSRANAWYRPGAVPACVRLPLSLNFRSQTASVGSKLHFMCAEPDGMVSYDVATGEWRQYAIPSPVHLTDHALAESGGQLVLVGLLSKNAATCVCVWELQRMTLLWKEVDRMPNVWCLEFYGKHVRMTCLGGNGGLLMLSLRSRRMNRLVTYDVPSREWRKVPDCVLPLPRGRKRQWIACGAAFRPSPTAAA